MTIATSPSKALIERYIEAKDFHRPEGGSAIWTPDAVLTFSIATGSITFPARVEGCTAITATLIADFGERFDRCRTYCVCDSPPTVEHGDVTLPWVVLMREIVSETLRIGRGWYRWTLAPATPHAPLASALHIHIDLMEPVPDPGGSLLAQLQAPLTYPWLAPALLRDAMEDVALHTPGLDFAATYAEPAPMPEFRPVQRTAA